MRCFSEVCLTAGKRAGGVLFGAKLAKLVPAELSSSRLAVLKSGLSVGFREIFRADAKTPDAAFGAYDFFFLFSRSDREDGLLEEGRGSSMNALVRRCPSTRPRNFFARRHWSKPIFSNRPLGHGPENCSDPGKRHFAHSRPGSEDCPTVPAFSVHFSEIAPSWIRCDRPEFIFFAARGRRTFRWRPRVLQTATTASLRRAEMGILSSSVDHHTFLPIVLRRRPHVFRVSFFSSFVFYII